MSDSLIRLVKNSGLNDTVKTRLYSDIGWEFIGNDIAKALEYFRKEYDLAVRTNRTGDLAQAESDLANAYNQKSSFDTSLIYHKEALKLRLSLKQDEKVAGIYTNIGVVLLEQNKFKEALEMNLKALKIFETLGNKGKQAFVLGNIGSLYRELKERKISEDFSRKGLALARETHLRMIEVRILGNLAAFKFQDFEKDSTNTQALDSALYFFVSGEKLMLAENDVFHLSTLYTNLGELYVKKRDYNKALESFERSLKMREAMQDKLGTAFSFHALGKVYIKKKDYEKAILYFNKSIAVFKELKAYADLSDSFRQLSIVYKLSGDYKQAMSNYEFFSQYKDSAYSSDNARHIAEMQTKYETEKKDLELAKNKAELQTKEEQAFIKNVIILAIICLLVLSAAAAYFFYRKKQVQQKAEADAELVRQKEIRNRSVIEAEEKERIRIATDLHDGVGQLLSAAKLNLSSLQSELNMQGPAQELKFTNAMSLVDDSVKEVRAVSHNMMPNVLLKLGLASAVKEFITKIQGMPNLKVNLEIVGMEQRLEQEKETVLYRVIQELVSNIIRHAKASELTLQLIRHEKELSVVIEDNGVGFDTAKLNDFEGIGLKNILSRVEFINGTVHFDSAPGRGTTVLIDVLT